MNPETWTRTAIRLRIVRNGVLNVATPIFSSVVVQGVGAVVVVVVVVVCVCCRVLYCN